ncbi:hypothetical protein F8388_012735 [Cannabis sativa]|uniref:RNase H type-1 domain-containing protein n=1 Tax=Cannabis sativa TaxID=3483 RepID=A0A7J6HCQ0_CANSA|nr:hypothetical protein F8388_012735 [Cannabis sativa]
MSARHKMLHKIEEFISVHGNSQDCNELHQFSREKVWCVPNEVHGFFVTDASWKEGRAGIAVGYQDRQSGKWLWSARAMEADSAMEAEALAVFWALQLGSECGFSSIAVASDALLLVQSLNARKLPPCWKSRAAVAKIWTSLTNVVSTCFLKTIFKWLKFKSNNKGNIGVSMVICWHSSRDPMVLVPVHCCSTRSDFGSKFIFCPMTTT